MKKLRHLVSVLLALCLVLPAAPAALAAGEDSCGDGLSWALEDGTLTVWGQGEIDGGTPPWQAEKSQITALVLEEGVTAVGESAFRDCANLRSVRFPSTLRTIGSSAFYGCGLTTLDLPEGLEAIGDSAFRDCPFPAVTIPASVTSLGAYSLGSWSASVTFEGLSSSSILPVINAYGHQALRGSAKVQNWLSWFYNDLSTAREIRFQSENAITDLLARLCVQKLMRSGTITGYTSGYDWLCGNCGWTTDNSINSHAPYADGPFFYGYATCNGYAHAIKAILDELNIPNFILTGYCTGEYGRMRHAWNNLYVNGCWYHMDATDTRRGDHSTFMMTDYTLDSGHSGGMNIKYEYTRTSCDSKRESCLSSWAAKQYTGDTLAYELQADGTYFVSDCDPMAVEAVVPEQHLGIPVTGIAPGAFDQCMKLRSVSLPEGLVSIGASAFSLCIALEEISFPSTLETIDSGAFSRCISLGRLDLSRTALKEFSGSCLYLCVSLNRLDLPAYTQVSSLNYTGNLAGALGHTDGSLPLTVRSYWGSAAQQSVEALDLPKEVGFSLLGGPLELTAGAAPGMVRLVVLNQQDGEQRGSCLVAAYRGGRCLAVKRVEISLEAGKGLGTDLDFSAVQGATEYRAFLLDDRLQPVLPPAEFRG